MGKQRAAKNKWPTPRQPVKYTVQKSPSKRLSQTNALLMVPDAKATQKAEDCLPPEKEEQEVKPEESAKERKRKDEEKQWSVLKKKFGEQAAKETKEMWMKLAEEEKRYQEQKRLDEEKERRREDKLANILAIETDERYDVIYEKDDDVFEEEYLSGTDSSISLLLDETDLDDFERETMNDISRDVRERLTSVSN